MPLPSSSARPTSAPVSPPRRGVRVTPGSGSRFARRLGVVATLLFASARAGAASPTDQAKAEALFDEGRRLLAAARFAEACPKFAESQRLDSALGTLLNLGDCYEKM